MKDSEKKHMDKEKNNNGRQPLCVLLPIARYRDFLPRRSLGNYRNRSFRGLSRFPGASQATELAKYIVCCLKRLTLRLVVLILLGVLALGFLFGLLVQRKHGLGLGCKAFIKTATSTLSGAPLFEVDCQTTGKERGGYCICEGDLAVAAPTDPWGKTTCRKRCRDIVLDKAIPIPDSSSCPLGTPAFFPALAVHAKQVLPVNYSTVTSFWERITESISEHDVIVLPPGKRDINDDFVAKGLRMDAQHIFLAKRQWRDFLDLAGPYPQGAFGGRGIVILGGDIQPYLVPALIAVKAIRRTGCTLPIEMWFPADEVITGPLVGKLKAMDVHIWTFPVPRSLGKGFYMKAAVLLLSSFQEVLFLDADQVPVRDVTQLFRTPEYLAYGALLWPDFWDATWAPDAVEMLGINADKMPRGSLESGQMLMDKKRVWPAIISALHFNLHNQLFYPLFTNYMGYGDKETFGMALLSHQIPFHVIEHPIRSLGFAFKKCGWFGCDSSFKTTTMVQHDTEGGLMFLHTNMPPKWQLLVTTDKTQYRRRWQTMQPGLQSHQDEWLNVSTTLFGEDIEMYVHDQLVSLRCDEHLAELHDRYLEARPEKVPLLRLPYVPEGVNLLQFYEQTQLSGTFVQDESPSLLQRLHHWWAARNIGKSYLREDTVTHPRHSFTLTRLRLWEQQQDQKKGKGPRLIQSS